MNGKFAWVAILISGLLFLVGCGGGSDGESEIATNSDATTTTTPVTASDNTAPAANPAVTDQPAEDAPPDLFTLTDQQFIAYKPTGLRLVKTYLVNGQPYNVFACDPIPGAVKYWFNTTIPEAGWGFSTPSGAIPGTTPGVRYSVYVYADNANGWVTQQTRLQIN